MALIRIPGENPLWDPAGGVDDRDVSGHSQRWKLHKDSAGEATQNRGIAPTCSAPEQLGQGARKNLFVRLSAFSAMMDEPRVTVWKFTCFRFAVRCSDSQFVLTFSN